MKNVILLFAFPYNELPYLRIQDIRRIISKLLALFVIFDEDGSGFCRVILPVMPARLEGLCRRDLVSDAKDIVTLEVGLTSEAKVRDGSKFETDLECPKVRFGSRRVGKDVVEAWNAGSCDSMVIGDSGCLMRQLDSDSGFGSGSSFGSESSFGSKSSFGSESSFGSFGSESSFGSGSGFGSDSSFGSESSSGSGSSPGSGSSSGLDRFGV